MRFSSLFVVLAIAACGSGSATAHSYVDSAGRHCTISDLSLAAKCDATPMPAEACAAGYSACFLVAPYPRGATQPIVLQVDNCAGCCSSDGNAAHASGSTQNVCSPIVCKADADCPEGHCAAGTCIE